MAIEWRWIPGFEGRYKVSSDGTVVSEPRYYARGGTLKPRRTRYNPAKGGVPYLVVRLYPGDGTFADKMVHIAVLEAFSGSRPPGREGRHLDGDSLNNKRENLIWGTHRENMRDKLLHGTDAQVLKTHCPQGHEYTPANTYVGRSASGGTCRTCRRCRADREQRRREART